MKYCSYCGAPIEDDAKFCPSCGARCEETDVYDSSSSKPAKKSSDNCKVFGILSVVFGALGGWLGLVFGIIGLCKDKEKKYTKLYVIGICLSVVGVILSIVIMVLNNLAQYGY